MNKEKNWRRLAGRILTMTLSLLLVFSFVGGITSIDAFAEGGDTVTRAEWLSALVETFEMTVDDDSMMPDNYFSDLDPESDYYKDFLLAVQFGLVDVEAGDPVYPEEPTTREFAASTLNFCLGFQLEAGTEYTFSDAADMADPASAQVAVDHGWLALIDGKFSPSTNITKDEKAVMLADASEIWHSTDVDENHEDQYELKDGVTEIPDGTEIDVTADGKIVITDCPVSIASGDTFVVHLNGIPVAYTAIAVDTQGNKLTIDAEEVESEEAFDELDIQGTMDGSALILGEANSDFNVNYYEEPTRGGQKAGGTISLKNTSLTFKGTVPISDGHKVTVSGKYSDIKITYNVTLTGENYIKVTGKTTFSAKASIDLMEASGLNEITIVPATIPGVGGFDLIVELKLGGSISVTAKSKMTLGLAYTAGGGLRLIKEFSSPSFSFTCEIEGQAGLKARLGITEKMLPFKGYVYAGCGGRAKVASVTYPSGTPKNCTTFVAWFYAEAGAEASVKLATWSASVSAVYEVYNETNSPLRAYHHYEDWKEVPRCTREDDFKYYTKWNSAMWPSGWSNGMGSYGFDEYGEPVEIYTYEVITIDYEDYAKITGFYGNVRSLTIPETIDGYTVIEIGEGVFEGLGQIDSVNIADTVKIIGSYAFNNCTSLSQVTLPESLEELGSRTFGGCSSLTYVTIPKSLKTTNCGLWEDAGPFAECINLKDVQLEKGMTVVASGLFAGCTGIEEITIPDTVTEIGDCAFSKASNLRKVVMPDTVAKIEANAFAECPKLSEINLSRLLNFLGCSAFANDLSIASVDIPKSLKDCGNSIWGNCGPYVGCENLKTVTFEKGTTVVAPGLFAGCTGIEEITIPGTVTEIKDASFKAASNLRKVVMPDTVTRIESEAFANCTELSDINLSRSLDYLGFNAFDYDLSLTSIDIPKSLRECGNSIVGDSGPFTGCKYLKTVTFEEGTKLVAPGLLAGCPGIEKITVPETVVTIGTDAFHGAANLSEVTLPDVLETIESAAFGECTLLKTVKIPDKVETIGAWAFQNCVALNDIVIPDSVKTLEDGAFAGCSSLEKINIPPAIEYIVRDLFNGDKALKTIEWNDKVERIYGGAFRGTGFESIEIPDTVTLIEERAFEECSDLKSVKLPDSVKEIYTFVFANCEALTDVSLGEGFTVLPESMFEGCSSLQKIILPHKLEKIEPNVFKNCTEFKEITIFRYAEDIDASAFSYPAKLTIRGIKGTYAEEFANDNDIKFEEISIAAKTITLKNTEITMKRGETFKLWMTVDPVDYTDVPVWKTGNADIVTVEDGLVTAEGVGETKVRVSIGSTTAECKVTVVQPVEYIDFYCENETLDAGETEQIYAEAGPENADNLDLTWSTNDAGVATVSDTGLVTAIAKGTAKITATSVSNPEVSATCTITVRNNKYVVTTVDELQSPHPYENNCSDIWSYTDSGATGLAVTFSSDTETDDFGDNPDRICLLNANGIIQGEYKGNELKGQTVKIPGDTVMIRLITDASDTAYGFKVTKIERTDATCDHSVDEWTDNEDGTHTGVCTKCGDQITENHTYEWNYEDDYWHYGECTKCYAYLTEEHQWEDVVVVKEPTLTEYGEEFYKCSICGYEKTEEIDPINSGDCGDDVAYHYFDDDSEIYIYGSGPMWDYTGDKVSPFASQTAIEIINIGDGVTSIGAGAFSGATKAEVIKIPKSVTSIGAGALTGCSFVRLEYEGSAEAFDRISMDEATKKAFEDAEKSWGETSGTDISGFDAEIEGTNFVYDGTAFKPAVSVYDDNGYPLFDEDYKVTYSNNVNAGTAKVTVTGTGDYYGTITLSFRIKQATLTGLKLSKTVYVYTGSYIKPVPTKSGLVNGKDFTLSYQANMNAGTATVIAAGAGNYTGKCTLKFTINKAANPMTAKGKTASIKYSKLKSKKQTITKAKAYTISKAKGTVSYKLASVTKSKFKKYFTVNATTGKITVKKGLKKGTYKVKVKVTAAGNSNYKALTKTVTVTVKVK